MRMRGDMACFHEPYGEAWYQGDDARAPRLTAGSPRKPGLTYATVLDKLQTAGLKQPVFSKDMPQFTNHLWSNDFFDSFQHTFLIRDPAKVLTSLHKSWTRLGDDYGFERNEIGFDEQRELFDILAAHNGQPPTIIDSDDLLEDPHTMVKAYCDAIGVPFIPESLTWEPGSRAEVLWYDSNDSIWHDALKNSDGLKPQPQKPADVSRLPPRLQALYDEFMPHYQHLYEFRLQG